MIRHRVNGLEKRYNPSHRMHMLYDRTRYCSPAQATTSYINTLHTLLHIK